MTFRNRFSKNQLLFTLLAIGVFNSPVFADEFTGGGASIYFGSGTPNSIDGASELADDYQIKDETGNFMMGVVGFFQGDNFRGGAAFQMHAWAGVNAGEQEADDDTAGAAAVVFGFYCAWTPRHDRMLLNVGAVIGAGKAILGYSLGEDRGDIDESVTVGTFYLEPFVSVGVATGRWFGVEFQLSAPIFILQEDLQLTTVLNKTYTVKGSEMSGLSGSIKLTFGKIADP
jgi:hypothetical protein